MTINLDTVPEVRVLSVKQPWAGLIAGGHKDVENRTFGTDYRGLVAIASSLTLDLSPHAIERMGAYEGHYYDTGVIVALVDLVDVTTGHPSHWAEPGKTHWVLDNARPLQRPIRHRGQLGLTRLDPGTADFVIASAHPLAGGLS